MCQTADTCQIIYQTADRNFDSWDHVVVWRSHVIPRDVVAPTFAIIAAAPETAPDLPPPSLIGGSTVTRLRNHCNIGQDRARAITRNLP